MLIVKIEYLFLQVFLRCEITLIENNRLPKIKLKILLYL